MIRYIVSVSILIFAVTFSSAQSLTAHAEREIAIYKVVVKTKRGLMKGVLQRVAPDHLLIETDRGIEKIAAETINYVKVKFDKRKTMPILRDIAQAGFDVIVDPQYTTTVTAYETGFYPDVIPLDQEEAPLGSRLLMGTAMVGGALLGNEIAKIVPPATIETFKIKYSKARYQGAYEALAMYSVHLQSSPAYELILKNELKRAMEAKKLKT